MGKDLIDSILSNVRYLPGDVMILSDAQMTALGPRKFASFEKALRESARKCGVTEFQCQRDDARGELRIKFK